MTQINNKIGLNADIPVVNRSSIDNALSRFLRVQADKLPETRSEHDLMSDIFFSLFKGEPTLKEEIPAERAVNGALINWMLEEGASRESTIGRIPASLVSSPIMWAGLTTDSAIKEALDFQEKADEARRKAEEKEREATELAQQLDNASGDEKQELEKEINKLLDKASKLRDDADKNSQAGVDAIGKTSAHPIKKKAMQEAVAKAEEKAEETNKMTASWGIGSNPTAHDIEVIQDALHNPLMFKISEVLGRAKGIARAEFARKQRGVLMNKVNFTKEIDNLFTSEIVDLTARAPLPLRAKKLRQLTQQGLLGWRPVEEAKHSGSFIGLIDESGSMSTHGCAFAKSMMLGIVKSLEDIETNRPWELFGFDYSICSTTDSTASWIDQLTWAKSYQGGGTSITRALRKAFERADAMAEAGIEGVDIVLLTDGCDRISEDVWVEFEELKEALGTRLIVIDIGGNNYNTDLQEKASLYLSASNIDNFEQSVEGIVQQIADLVSEGE